MNNYTDYSSSFMHSEKTVEKCHLCGNFEEENSDETKLILVREEKICKGCLTYEDCAEDVIRVFNPTKGKFAWEQFNSMGHSFKFWNQHLQATPSEPVFTTGEN